MAVFVDPPVWPWRGQRWSHVISDTSIEELHAFAREAGIPWRGFGFDHYDIPEHMVDHVVELGATLIDARQVVRKLREAGIRTGLGKSAKRWTSVDASTRQTVLDEHQPTVTAAAELLGANADEPDLLVRPSEVLISLEGPRRPADQEVRALDAGFAGRAVRSPWFDQWAIELVLTR